MNHLLQFAGMALILLSVADVFMTVLYARVGTGPMSHRLASWSWAIVRKIARRLPEQQKDTLLSFFGPGYLVLLTSIWIALLLFGFTLIAWPGLGTGIRSTAGQTPRDFLTAFYYAGGSMTTVGSGDLQPASALFKCLTVVDSILGMLVLTMAVTYIIQIYTALQRRNDLALGLHHASGGTGDAAALLAGLSARDDFTQSGSSLSSLASEVTSVYESHHFYSVLIYFRFREPHYAMARGTLITMEMISLIDSALDENRHGWLKRSSSITQIREGGMHVLTELAGVYLPGKRPEAHCPEGKILDHWRQRYFAALDYLRHAGISVVRDAERGAERYVELRSQWDPFVMAFAGYMEHTLPEIDPIGTNPSETGHHREMDAPPLKAAG